MSRARPLGTLVLAIVSAMLGCGGGDRPTGFAVIAHRGESQTVPENTLRAIGLAFDWGADMVEVDVHVSRDGVPVIIHDDTLEATTNGHGRVADQTLAELRTLDAGSWKGTDHAGERIPTLKEALDLARGRSLLIDPKHDGMGEAIARVFRDARVPTSRAIMGAWNEGQIADFARNLPGSMILRSDNEGTPQVWDPDYFAKARAQGIRGFEAGNKWSAAFVADARAHGMPVYAYTVNDEPTMRHLIEIGVAGIETDALSDLVRTAKRLSPSFPRVAMHSRP